MLFGGLLVLDTSSIVLSILIFHVRHWGTIMFFCASRIFVKTSISILILLPEKFLQFDWLRADVFQLNLKYLHVKITVTMVTPNHQIISSHELRKNGGKISRF